MAQAGQTEEQVLQLDGEVIGKRKTLDVDIIPGKVQLISSQENVFVKDNMLRRNDG